MNEVFVTAAVFSGIYMVIKVFTDFLLKRRIIKGGHIDKAGILEPMPATSSEKNHYPTLKWGLVFLMAGAGLILIELLAKYGTIRIENGYDSFLPFGIELVFISAGFLIYFLIISTRKFPSR